MNSIDPIIKAAKPGQKLVIPPGTYTTAGTLAFRQDGLDIDFAGVVLANLPKSGTLFIPQGNGQTIRNLTMLAGPGIFNPQGDSFTAEACFIGGQMVAGKWVASPPGSVGQAMKTGNNGTNARINNSHVGHCATVSVYHDRDGGGGTNTTFEAPQHPDGSSSEYCQRGDTPDGKIVPKGQTWKNCTFNAMSGTGTKDAAGARKIGTKSDPVVYDGCTFTGNDLRIGEGNQPATTKPGDFANVIVKGCTFKAIPGKSPIAVLQGGMATVTGCTFVEPADPPIAADSMSLTMYSGNTQKVASPANAQPWFTSPQGGIGTDGGGNQIVKA